MVSGPTESHIDITVDSNLRPPLGLEADGLFNDVDFAVEPVVSLTRKGIISHWSPAAARLFGYKARDVINRPVMNLIPREYRSRLEPIVNELVSGNTSFDRLNSRVLPIRRKDGSKIYVEASEPKWSPEKEGDITVILRDVTEIRRHRREENLKNNFKKHRRLFEEAPISMWLVDYSKAVAYLRKLRERGISDWRTYFRHDPDAVADCLAKLRIIDINQATLKLFGAERKDDLVKALTNKIFLGSLSSFADHLAKVAEGSLRYVGISQASTLDSQTFPFSIEIFNLPENDNAQLKAYWAITDISEHKRAEYVSKRRFEYERVISGLSTRFVAPVSFSDAINTTLQEIGLFCRVDHVFLIFFNSTMAKLQQTYMWRSAPRPAEAETTRRWDPDQFPFLMSKLKCGEAVRFDDVADSPELNRSEKDLLTKLNVKSLLMMPLSYDSNLIGCIGLCCKQKTKTWKESDRSLLLVSSTVISHALKRQAADESVKASERKYRTLIESASDAIIAADAKTGVIVDANKEAARLLKRSIEELIGMHQSEVHPPEKIEHYRSLFSKRINHGRGFTTDLEVVTADGERVPVDISAATLDIGGQEIVLGIFHNTSENRQKQELRETLNKIISIMNSTLQFDYIVRRVLIESSKALGAKSAMTVMADGQDFAVSDAYGLKESIIGKKISQSKLSYVIMAARKGYPLVFNNALQHPHIDKDIIKSLQVKSMLVVPLLSRREIMGALVFYDREERKPYTDPQIDFAAQIGTATSFALENARLYAEKRHIADALQQSLLTMPKDVPGVRFGNIYRSATRTARVGGDFYDIFPLRKNKIGIVIGDVSGKGLKAAKLTSLIKNSIRAYALEDYSTSEVVSKTNWLMLQVAEPSTFITVFFGILDTSNGILDYCSAGHPPALIKSGAEVLILEGNSPAIGISPDFEFVGDYYRLKKSEVLFLYTDGATDVRYNKDFFGEERLRKLLSDLQPAATEEVPHLIFAELVDFSETSLSDDLALLTVSLA